MTAHWRHDGARGFFLCLTRKGTGMISDRDPGISQADEDQKLRAGWGMVREHVRHELEHLQSHWWWNSLRWRPASRSR